MAPPGRVPGTWRTTSRDVSPAHAAALVAVGMGHRLVVDGRGAQWLGLTLEATPGPSDFARENPGVAAITDAERRFGSPCQLRRDQLDAVLAVDLELAREIASGGVVVEPVGEAQSRMMTIEEHRSACTRPQLHKSK